MNTRKILVGGTSIALLALSLSACGGAAESSVAKGCQPASTFKTISAGFLTVAAPEFPPFSGLLHVRRAPKRPHPQNQ